MFDIIVFATKRVGYETIKCLSKKYKRFDLVTKEDEGEIIDFFKNNISGNLIFYQSDLQLKKRYDWLLNLWSPFILSKKILSQATYHLNIHPSLSPCCLGNDNATWIIRNRAKAGVSLLEMTEKVDEANIWIQQEVEYSYPIKGKELQEKLIIASIELFCKYFDDILNLHIPNVRLQKDRITKYKREDTNKDKEIEPTKAIEEFINKVLAHDFSPKHSAYIFLEGKRYKITLDLEEI